MKKKMFALVVFSLSLLLGSNAGATLYTFSGTDGGAVGSATMDITISGNVLTAVLDNTSPITRTDGTTANAPGITGFGFNLDPDTLGLLSWNLQAFNSLSALLTIGDNLGVNDDWIMDTSIAGVDLDYLPATEGNNIQGALYNPAAIDSGALSAVPNYFTTATLTMTFDNAPTLVWLTENIGTGQNKTGPSPFVRMQSVGNDGSLKLSGTPVPEPATMLLFGTGLVGLAGIARRRNKK